MKWEKSSRTSRRLPFGKWCQTATIRPNIKLDEWVVMPNHFHAIVVIDNGGNCKNNRRDEATPRLYHDIHRTHHNDNVDNRKKYNGPHPQMSKISPKPKSLSSTIGSFKSICTKRIHKIRLDFAWQSRFYDHIVRDDSALNEIRKYIRANPIKWWQDRNNRRGLFM
jgi:putative transposase